MYEVCYSLASNFTNATTVQTILTTATLNNLASREQYYIRVRALNGELSESLLPPARGQA